MPPSRLPKPRRSHGGRSPDGHTVSIKGRRVVDALGAAPSEDTPSSSGITTWSTAGSYKIAGSAPRTSNWPDLEDAQPLTIPPFLSAAQGCGEAMWRTPGRPGGQAEGWGPGASTWGAWSSATPPSPAWSPSAPGPWRAATSWTGTRTPWPTRASPRSTSSPCRCSTRSRRPWTSSSRGRAADPTYPP